MLTAGQVHDIHGARALLVSVPPMRKLIADKAYDANDLRDFLANQGTESFSRSGGNVRFSQLPLQSGLSASGHHTPDAIGHQTSGTPPSTAGSVSPTSRPSTIASTTLGASSVSRSIVPRYPRSIRSAAASSLTDAYRPSSSSRCHRNARASAFSSAGSARVRTTPTPA